MERLHDKDFGDFVSRPSWRPNGDGGAPGLAGDADPDAALFPPRRRHDPADGAGGDAAQWRADRSLTTETGDRNRRLVLLLDVSGSMESHAKVLIRFAHAVVGRATSRCSPASRLTELLANRHRYIPRSSQRRQGRWRIIRWYRFGDLLDALVRACGPGMARGAIVVVLSDGWTASHWQVGNGTAPAALAQTHLGQPAEGWAWLRTNCTRHGGRTPFCDAFLEGHLWSVTELALSSRRRSHRLGRAEHEAVVFVPHAAAVRSRTASARAEPRGRRTQRPRSADDHPVDCRSRRRRRVRRPAYMLASGVHCEHGGAVSDRLINDLADRQTIA